MRGIGVMRDSSTMGGGSGQQATSNQMRVAWKEVVAQWQEQTRGDWARELEVDALGDKRGRCVD